MNQQTDNKVKKEKTTSKLFNRATLTIWLMGTALFISAIAMRLDLLKSYAHTFFYWAALVSLGKLVIYSILFFTLDMAENKGQEDDIELAHARSWHAVGINILSMFSEGSADVVYTLTIVALTLECVFFAGLHYWPAVSAFMQQFLVS